MLLFGSFAFAEPAVLLALAALPVVWWLVRVTPPAPRRIAFPAIRLLHGLRPSEEEPARTPLWLMLLRLFLAVLVILALARPLIHPRGKLGAKGPVLLLVDNGWAAAEDWEARLSLLLGIASEAGREGRSVLLLPTANPAGGARLAPLAPVPAKEARTLLRALKPLPWPVDRIAALARLKTIVLPGGSLAIWLSDGLESGGALALADYLRRHSSLEVLTAGRARRPVLLLPGKPLAKDLEAVVESLPAGEPRRFRIKARSADGRLLARRTVTLEAGKSRVGVSLPMPGELRNRAARIDIEGVRSAAVVLLLDARWRRPRVGILASPRTVSAPLLSGPYYLERALTPFAEVRDGALGALLDRPLSLLILADGGPGSPRQEARIGRWVAAGGVLLRFAGPRLAAEAGDRLLPVRLRRGGRTLGGALSWERPATLAPFPAQSPFAGLSVPPDVTVSRQVMAEPGLGEGGKVWARLADGTPLVTAAKRGRGWIVLVHTTANASWSNLALSGLFVEMLRRVAAIGKGALPARKGTFAPRETLDGFGRLGRPPPSARSISLSGPLPPRVSPRNPPGFYGTKNARFALNLSSAVGRLRPLSGLAAGVRREIFAKSREIDLRPALLAAAMGLALFDLLIAYGLRGLLRRPRRRFAALLLFVFLVPAGARAGEAFDIKASARFHLAYVETGNERVDEISRAGLFGLSRVLEARTAVDPGRPIGLDIERDPLVFFPLIYWPLVAGERPPSREAASRIKRYLESGGTILFDTEEGGGRVFDPLRGTGEPSRRLRLFLPGVRIPPLVPIPPDHVLTKTFYLLHDFPGRFDVGTLWVEAAPGRVNDGVSSVILGEDDWAAAWAVDGKGRPLYPVVPGGERQRETARRFGVNLVMYVLTGNYKNDQLQVPAILRRLKR